jgi:hypothetical protein
VPTLNNQRVSQINNLINLINDPMMHFKVFFKKPKVNRWKEII